MNINPFIDLIVTLLNLYCWAIMAKITADMLEYFGVTFNSITFSRVRFALDELTGIVLNRCKHSIFTFGGFNLAPLVVLVLLEFLKNLLHTYLYMA